MKIYQFIHLLAMVFLLTVAALNLDGQLHISVGPSAIYFTSVVLGFTVWALLLWKLYTRPKQWGLGIGIFLLLVSALQIYLWHVAVNRPEHIGVGIYAHPWNIIWCEMPLIVGAVCCILLKLVYPSSPNALLLKPDEQAS